MIGKRIKEIRNNNGLTQKEFAELLGVSESAVKKWELNKVDPTVAVLNTIADKFNLTVDYIIMRTDNPKPLIVEPDPIKKEVERYEAYLRGINNV